MQQASASSSGHARRETTPLFASIFRTRRYLLVFAERIANLRRALRMKHHNMARGVDHIVVT
jgi:hypothetical protein